MKKAFIYSAIILIFALALPVNTAQAQRQLSTDDRDETHRGEFQLANLLAQPRATRRTRFSLIHPSHNVSALGSIFNIMPMSSGPTLQVLGGGTLGRLTKWTGLTSSNSFIGDTTIFEDKNGLVGIGTDSPTSKLTVAGTIQSLSGGFKFPDGTIQTTSSAGALFSISHDQTLTGAGTAASPLGVAVPLNLAGAVAPSTAFDAVIKATNTAAGGFGLTGIGGNSSPTFRGGVGVAAIGGRSNSSFEGGAGMAAKGGDSDFSIGGFGVGAVGGQSTADGGDGVDARGGRGGTFGGTGVHAIGGEGGDGGFGVVAFGGLSSGSGFVGGDGVLAKGGTGENGATDGVAGNFMGDVSVSGNLSKGGGSFKIDHPLDPENKYLYHSFVESPDMKNIYDGNVTTDASGDAVITLPDWFEALNRDFRYQLTVIGAFAQAIVADEIRDNRFTIKTSAPNVKVSWQVTGIRQDAYANKHRIPVEEEKPNRERGSYLHPDAFNQPEERGIEWSRRPELLQRLKQQRIEAEHRLKAKQLDR